MWFYIGILCAILFSVLFITQIFNYISFSKTKKDVQSFAVASAGKIYAGTPKEIGILHLQKEKFILDETTPKFEDLKKFVIRGSSMLLCGIKNNDIILVDSNYNLIHTNFPCVYVLRRDDELLKDANKKNDYALFKVRRSWTICNIGEKNAMLEIIDKIMQTTEFISIKKQYTSAFQTPERLKEDFEKRLQTYREKYPHCSEDGDANNQVVISTTLNKANDRVHFSIHPTRMIEGEVLYSFNISPDNVLLT